MELKVSRENSKSIALSFLGLFSSLSTLICCAIPALFVSLGMGATLVGIVSNFPSLIWISEHKAIVFFCSAILLVISSVAQYRTRNIACPIDPDLARACKFGRVWSKRITIFSIFVWLLGAGFAFIPRLLT